MAPGKNIPPSSPVSKKATPASDHYESSKVRRTAKSPITYTDMVDAIKSTIGPLLTQAVSEITSQLQHLSHRVSDAENNIGILSHDMTSVQMATASLEKENYQLLRKRSSTARPHPTLPRDADGANAGSSSANPPPLRCPSQGSDPQHRRQTKRRRLEAKSPAASSPPQRRISIVSALPPQGILASPQSEDPQSPQLSEPPLMAEDSQQESDQQDTYTLHLQAIDPTETTTPQDIPQPPQTSHSPQLSPTPPQQMAPEFWSSWATQQAQHYACLNTHTQYHASLPHHLPRLSRNSGRLIVQVGRIANSMEQMGADNTQMQANLQRIMEQRQQQPSFN
ncbi:polycystin-1-like protein 3 [Pseudophryne corroboree]|uniref:polycystin-1-like protein 3 n=1 Tax=Pseudophryne corroboree TaxID=495146 RepID=UPI003081EBFB